MHSLSEPHCHRVVITDGHSHPGHALQEPGHTHRWGQDDLKVLRALKDGIVHYDEVVTLGPHTITRRGEFIPSTGIEVEIGPRYSCN